MGEPAVSKKKIVPHCWEDGPRTDDDCGTTCMLLDGHHGPHQWCRDDQIGVRFAPAKKEPYRPVIVEYPGAGYAEFLVADVATIVTQVDRYGTTPVLDFARNVVGFRWPLAPSTSGGKK